MTNANIRRQLEEQTRRAAERRQEVQDWAEEERQTLSELRLWAVVVAITVGAIVALAAWGAVWVTGGL